MTPAGITPRASPIFIPPTASLCASSPQLRHLNSRPRFTTRLEWHSGHSLLDPRSSTRLTTIPYSSAFSLNRLYTYPTDQKLCIIEFDFLLYFALFLISLKSPHTISATPRAQHFRTKSAVSNSFTLRSLMCIYVYVKLATRFIISRVATLTFPGRCGIGGCSMETDKSLPTYTLKLFI